MTLFKEEIVIYGAGKTWAAGPLKDARDNHGFNINSHWIDISGALSSPRDEYDYNTMDLSFLDKMWDHGCKVDACVADMVAVYATREDGEKHSGALVEIGHATASYIYLQVQKPVYLIGSCKSFEKVGHSDRGFTHQRVFHRLPTDNLVEGLEQACKHYSQNYYQDWVKWRAILNSNEMMRAMIQYCNTRAEETVDTFNRIA